MSQRQVLAPVRHQLRSQQEASKIRDVPAIRSASIRLCADRIRSGSVTPLLSPVYSPCRLFRYLAAAPLFGVSIDALTKTKIARTKVEWVAQVSLLRPGFLRPKPLPRTFCLSHPSQKARRMGHPSIPSRATHLGKAECRGHPLKVWRLQLFSRHRH